MAKASKGKEIILVTSNKVGTLAKISDVIADAGVNVKAILARGEKRKAYFHLIVDRHMKAANALKKAGYEVGSQDVVILAMDNKPGEMNMMAEKIAEAGIDIYSIYGSANGAESFCVLRTDNDKEAMKAVKRK